MGWPNTYIDLKKYQEPYQAATIGFKAGITFVGKNYLKCWSFTSSAYTVQNQDLHNGNTLYANYFGRNIRIAPYSLGQRLDTSLNFKNSNSAWVKIGDAEYNVSLAGANVVNDSTGVSSFGICGDAGVRTYYFNISQEGEITRKMVPVVDAAGVPCMFDSVKKETFYNNTGTLRYIVGMTLEQARKLSKLPKTGGELTISLPWEAQLVQHNAEVEAALETARSKGWLMKVQYREAEPDGVIYNKYATCASVADMQAVNADYKQDLTADGEWLYPLEKLKTATSVFNGAKELKIWRMNLPAVTSIPDGFGESGLTEFNATISASNINAVLYKCNDLEQIELDAPNATAGINAFGSSPARRIKVNLPKLQNGHLLCGNCSNLEDFDGTLPSVTNLTSAFSNCVLNKASVLRIIDSLLSFTDGATHALTLGIHVNNKSDEEVLAAIENAEAKGWSVAVQWNGAAGTSTASTYGLRRQPIYAKASTLEMPDGAVKSILDWGHYVTNWEENGYREFTTVEEAKEYFGIEKETV